MKRKLLACTALVLCLALLCGCTSIATSEWMQDLFPVGDEAVAAQQTGSVEDSTAEQEVKQVVTETAGRTGAEGRPRPAGRDGADRRGLHDPGLFCHGGGAGGGRRCPASF